VKAAVEQKLSMASLSRSDPVSNIVMMALSHKRVREIFGR